MLEILFCNVGDGDAVLVREWQEETPLFTLLVDSGRPFLEPKNGSLRKEAVYYLREYGVTRIDEFVLTHLHIDHVGGAGRILETVPTCRLTALYFPPEERLPLAPSFTSVDKTGNGLRHMLSLYAELADKAASRGVCLREAQAGTQMLTDRLRVTTILPRPGVIRRQQRAFDALYHGKPIPEEDVIKAAKERNVSSLTLRLEYAGRSMLLTGDRYAADLEKEALAPCDVLKIPHHGDPKALTEGLLEALSPKLAVISCQSDADAKKDRPCMQTISLLRERKIPVLCTENKAVESLEASTHNGVRVAIGDDGALSWETL